MIYLIAFLLALFDDSPLESSSSNYGDSSSLLWMGAMGQFIDELDGM